jgi:hypothetical protein
VTWSEDGVWHDDDELESILVEAPDWLLRVAAYGMSKALLISHELEPDPRKTVKAELLDRIWHVSQR